MLNVSLPLLEAQKGTAVARTIFVKSTTMFVLAVVSIVLWLASLLCVVIATTAVVSKNIKCSLDDLTGDCCPREPLPSNYCNNATLKAEEDWLQHVGTSEVPYNYPMAANILLTLSFAVSLSLLVAIHDYYRYQIFISAEKDSLQTIKLPPVLRSQFRWSYMTEIIICAVQPLPFLNYGSDIGWASNGHPEKAAETLTNLNHQIKVGIIMFLRLYLFMRVQRDLSRTIREGRRWKKNPFVKFDWFLSLRLRFRNHPFKSIALFGIGGVIVCSICFYCAEWSSFKHIRCSHCNVRMFQPEDAIYLTLITMSTVGYGEVAPATIIGRIVAVITACIGLLMTALFIAAITAHLGISDYEHDTVTTFKLKKAERHVKDLGARVIQSFFRVAHSQQQQQTSADLTGRRSTAGSGRTNSVQMTRYRRQSGFRLLKLSKHSKLQVDIENFREARLRKMSLTGANDEQVHRMMKLDAKLEAVLKTISQHQIDTETKQKQFQEALLAKQAKMQEEFLDKLTMLLDSSAKAEKRIRITQEIQRIELDEQKEEVQEKEKDAVNHYHGNGKTNNDEDDVEISDLRETAAAAAALPSSPRDDDEDGVDDHNSRLSAVA